MMRLLRRLVFFLRRDRMEADLAEEMEFHRAQLERDLDGDRTAAARAMGNATLAREDARGVWIVPWIESLWQDLAYGFRGLRRQPGFTGVALAALSIAIGLNSGMFTVFNAVALRPWPVKNPARVVSVQRLLLKGPEAGGASGFGVAEWRYLSEHSKAFSGLILTRNGDRVEVDGGRAVLTWVTGNYFATMGVGMARGRGFRADEDRVEEPQAVAVLNYQAWQNRFGSDPAIVGRVVRLDEIPFTIVGVAAPDFAGTDPNRTDMWVPFPARQLLRPHDADVRKFLTSPDHCCSQMAGRLAPGITREQGAAEVALLVSQFHNQSERESGHAIVANGTAMMQAAGRNKRRAVPVLVAMFTAMTLVLLLACANVGNLLLARAAARRTEIAVRLSLGGSRLRLIRQLLVESLALAGMAAAIGLGIAWVAPAAILARMVPENAIRISPDLTVCAYTAGLGVLACLAFGLAPALHCTRDIAGALKSDARSTGPRLALRSLLLAAQVAISVVLLAGAGLLVRSLQHAQHLDPGFRVDGITIASLDLPAAAYSGPRAAVFTAALQDALAAASGLPPIAVTGDAPMANSRDWTSMRPSELPPDRDAMVQFHEIAGAYFDVLGIPIAAGRNFTRDDGGRLVAIVNEAAVKRFWNGVSPVGRSIASNQKIWEIVGIAKDAYTTGFETVEPTMYWPMAGRQGIPQLLIAGSSPAARDRIAALARQLDSKARVTFTPLSDNLRAQLEPSKNAAAIAGALGLLALALASIGMSGVFAYAVRQRTREIGVRMALGAQPAQVVRLVLGANLRAVACGLVLGVLGAAAASKLLRPLMIGASAFDPLAYLAMFAVLAVAAAAASFLPARRAAGVDPVTALRWE